MCNNCGNDLTFPNQQHLVTCPHCLTHLQIEELENTISATVVEDSDLKKINHLLSNEFLNIQSFAPLYNLLHLENEYSEILEENFFHSVLFGRQFRPILFRAISRMIFGVFFVLITLSEGGIYNGSFVAVLSILYSLFLFIVSIKEGIRWWRLRQFEKAYFQEQSTLITKTQALGLSSQLTRLFTDYQKNNDLHLETRHNYFYYHFLKFKIYIGTSVISQAFRLVPLGFIFIGVLFNLFQNYVLLSYLVVILFLTFLVILFFINISKSSDYSHLYTNILKERKTIIEKLNNHLSR
ncbi:MAG: hypothetical protein AB8G11_07685 [Saprospiraceae bacterium]